MFLKGEKIQQYPIYWQDRKNRQFVKLTLSAVSIVLNAQKQPPTLLVSSRRCHTFLLLELIAW